MSALRAAWCCSALLACALSVCAAPAAAQTLKEDLKEHVREGLEDEREKKKERKKDEAAQDDKKDADEAKRRKDTAADKDSGSRAERQAEPPRGTDGGKSPGGGDTLFSFSTEDDAAKDGPKPKEPEGPELPVRVIGKNLRLDVELGVGLRGWVPQQYDAVDVDTGIYTTWTIDVKARLFDFVNLRRGYYESNGVSAPRTEEAAVAAQIGSFAPKAVWLLGTLGIPITKAWEPVISYESRAFETRARPNQNVCVVDRDAPEDAMGCPGSMDDLKIVSGFETFVAGVRYDHGKDLSPVMGKKRKGKFPPIMFGVGLMSYRKPYQLTIGSQTLDDYLFDGRFRGAGLALGTELGGGLDRFYADIDTQFGLGEVSLTQDITLNEILNDTSVSGDLLIGYFQGSASLSYRWPIIRAAPTLTLVPSVRVGGTTFFLVDTQVDEDEETDSATVNWDFLWSARISLIVPL